MRQGGEEDEEAAAEGFSLKITDEEEAGPALLMRTACPSPVLRSAVTSTEQQQQQHLGW